MARSWFLPCPETVMFGWEDDRQTEIYKPHNQQDNCDNGIREHGKTSKNKVPGTDKDSKHGDQPSQCGSWMSTDL